MRNERERKGGGGLRLLRVGENIRHSLSSFLSRGDVSVESLSSASITVSEVRVSPDLRNATIFYMPLGGRDLEAVATGLKEAAPEMRKHLSKTVHMKYIPNLKFKLDESFDEASHIDGLLRNPKVQRDLKSSDLSENGGSPESTDSPEISGSGE
ncbi:30S ribosome-binding factor RbfA [Temperatibacter marinus]|uniref:Ribosome-binding factor A n=1 Tax=Temperatibacter marinus TaxID=1456591 RepID=A0AA52H961_9PROT|nr:30S ribosome-binding factor RbfA [Temperatibacter marinus]WND01355.1 30S ribosome-binding factor RbfA [Temperatibacter marinus]